ncbi:MAG: carboxypeptidase-like regulatory domain-containing protein [Candidatus Dojkabacteria bacterium]|nr:MAG: carboxypeptidase-like regulatory domain-containing protein [Candidatus Dojkabacteria bacterium]
MTLPKNINLQTVLLVVLFILGAGIVFGQLIQSGKLALFDRYACEGGTFTSAQPSIQHFSVSNQAAVRNAELTFSWQTRNTDKVTISGISRVLASQGETSAVITRPGKYTLRAYNGNCFRERALTIVFGEGISAPWVGSIILIFFVLLIDAIRLAVTTDASIDSLDAGNIWLSLKEFIEKLQKKKRWGVVYDSTTKDPLSRVIIRLHDAATNALIETTVSGTNGIFKLNPKAGQYVIRVSKPGHVFPSQLVLTAHDGAFSRVYKGELLPVAVAGQSLHISIPMDPEDISQVSRVFRTSSIAMEAVFRWGGLLGMVIGGAISLSNAIIYPQIGTILTLAFFTFFIMGKLYSLFQKQKEFGVVKDVNGNFVANLEIGAFETEFNTLVARTFTDSEGRYSFIVPTQSYSLKVIDPRYALSSKTAINGGEPVTTKYHHDDNFILIAQDIVVMDMTQQNTTPQPEEQTLQQ